MDNHNYNNNERGRIEKRYVPQNNEDLKIDEIDILILRVLSEDARTPLREIAEKTGLAVSTIHSRITRLVSEGIIERFTIRIDPEKFGYITAFILLDTDGEKTEDVLKELAKKEYVLEAYESLGKFNVVLKVKRQKQSQTGY
jgi:DNA-binding Lrp family transcriptional regulator